MRSVNVATTNNIKYMVNIDMESQVRHFIVNRVDRDVCDPVRAVMNPVRNEMWFYIWK